MHSTVLFLGQGSLDGLIKLNRRQITLDPGIKRHVVVESIRMLAKNFEVVPMRETFDREPIGAVNRYGEYGMSG